MASDQRRFAWTEEDLIALSQKEMAEESDSMSEPSDSEVTDEDVIATFFSDPLLEITEGE